MRKLILSLLFVFVCMGAANAQCVGEVKTVKIDELRGSIIVETQYTLNGVDVQSGRTRYDETSGTAAEIDVKIKADIESHCANLIAREPANTSAIQAEMLKIATEKTAPIKAELETLSVGKKYTVSEYVTVFKDKQIEVTADGQKTVTSITVVDEPVVIK